MASLISTGWGTTLSNGEYETISNYGSTPSDYPYSAVYRNTTPSGSSPTTYVSGRKWYAKNQAGTQTTALNEYLYVTTSSFYTPGMSTYYYNEIRNITGTGVYTGAYTSMRDSTHYFGCSTSSANATDRFQVTYSSIAPSVDNTISCGTASLRFTVVYAVTGTINTSDITEKEQIQDLDVAEKNVALAIKGLIKKFKWKASVAEKGDNARIHVGVMAQEVRDAFVAQGLDPERYALFCKDVWWEREEPNLEKDPANQEHADRPDTQIKIYREEVEGGVRVEKYGIRYDQLLAFMIAAM